MLRRLTALSWGILIAFALAGGVGAQQMLSGGLMSVLQSGTWTVQPGNTANSTPWLTTDSATSATGSAPPAKAAFFGARESTNGVGVIQCDKTAQVTISTATTTALVAVSGATSVYVCSYVIEIQGVATTAGTLQLETGTGSACATAVVAVTPTYIGSTTAGTPTVIPQGSNLGYVIKGAASSGLCALSTTTTTQKVFIAYAQF